MIEDLPEGCVFWLLSLAQGEDDNPTNIICSSEGISSSEFNERLARIIDDLP